MNGPTQFQHGPSTSGTDSVPIFTFRMNRAYSTAFILRGVRMADINHPLCRGFGHKWSPPTWSQVFDSRDRVMRDLVACIIQCERCTSGRTFYYKVARDGTLGARVPGGGYRYVKGYLAKRGEHVSRHDAIAATYRTPRGRVVKRTKAAA